MATRQQLTLDEETVISPAYISAKLDEAISTLSIANISDTQLEQSTKRYNLLGGIISISWRYQDILSFRPPPPLKNIKSAHPDITVKLKKSLRRSTIMALRIHLPWRELPNHLILHSLRESYCIQRRICFHHVVPYDDPSIRACQSGDLAELRHILASWGYGYGTTDPDGRSLLHVEFGSLQGSERLLI
jgi:hypothetical protein